MIPATSKNYLNKYTANTKCHCFVKDAKPNEVKFHSKTLYTLYIPNKQEYQLKTEIIPKLFKYTVLSFIYKSCMYTIILVFFINVLGDTEHMWIKSTFRNSYKGMWSGFQFYFITAIQEQFFFLHSYITVFFCFCLKFNI